MKALSEGRERSLAVGRRVHRRAAAPRSGSRRPPPRSAGEPGLLSRYELGGLIGRGRLGSLVYEARIARSACPVAIRVLKRDEQPHWDAVRARFLLEARTLQVSHPSLLQVRDFGEDDRAVYLVTDLIEGPEPAAGDGRRRRRSRGRAPAPADSRRSRPCRALHAQGRLHLRRQSRHDPPRARDRTVRRASIVMSSAGIKSVQDVLATMREQELRGQEASEQRIAVRGARGPDGRRAERARRRVHDRRAGVSDGHGHGAVQGASLPELIGQMLQTKPGAAANMPPTPPAMRS